MSTLKIGIIGGGNMGSAIAKGFVFSGKYQPDEIRISTLDDQHFDKLKKKGFNTSKDNEALVTYSDVIFIAVKPYNMVEVLTPIKKKLKNKIVISVAAGFSMNKMDKILDESTIIFRMMPNIAAEICQSFTALCPAQTNKIAQKTKILHLLQLIGQVRILEESQLEAVTIMSGSGLAFVFRFLRAGMQGGTSIGLPPQLAGDIMAQVTAGASALLMHKNEHPEVTIDKVTTPKGTTITGLNVMEFNGFSKSLIEGIKKSYSLISED